MTYKYFFGSDIRSIPYLEFLNNKIENLKVVTTEPKKSGRGRQIKQNPVEDFCKVNKINFSYYSDSDLFTDMDYGLCVSFSAIFQDEFINNHPSIFNIHLSALPKLIGPSPVETSILNGESLFSYTIFKIVKEVDKGPILFQNEVSVINNYSSNVYKTLVIDFMSNFESIDFKSSLKEQTGKATRTNKFTKNDYFISNQNTLNEAKNKIKAFDVLGPAFIKFDSKIIKIHKYTENKSDFKIQLKDGFLHLDDITPEGKKRMKASDYMRGLN